MKIHIENTIAQFETLLSLPHEKREEQNTKGCEHYSSVHTITPIFPSSIPLLRRLRFWCLPADYIVLAG